MAARPGAGRVTWPAGGFGHAARRRIAGSSAWERVESAAGMWHVGVRTLRIAFTSVSWVPEAIAETSIAFRRCLIPLIASVAIIIAAYDVFVLGKVIQILGAPDRQAGGQFTGNVREVATWVTLMVFAGVAGSAVTADLGARKVREELDAMEVLGVEKVRSLVVPRVMAFTFAAMVLGSVAVFIAMFTAFVLTLPIYHLSAAVFIDNVLAGVFATDVYVQLLKHAILGFSIGVVCCVKGLQAKGGSEAVGRAVNQAVVISFLLVWMGNLIFNTAYLSLFPDVSVVRG